MPMQCLSVSPHIVPGRTIKINNDSKDAFTMGKIHKEVALYLTSSADNAQLADKEVVKVGPRGPSSTISHASYRSWRSVHSPC